MGRKGSATPYRGGGGASGGKKTDEDGLVDDVVRQFSDPFAFYRELVQNAIDAGARRIAVRIVHDDADGLTRVAVEDDGSGMTEAVLAEDLTVLFKSTKEQRDDAIGKFGIGFVSVLAIEPLLVAVDTSVGDGVRHRLELHPDHTWDLLRSDGEGRGTTVTLTVRIDDPAAFVVRSRASLERWCRHAQVPVTFVVHGGPEAHGTPERVDRPLALDDVLLEVAARSGDGRTEVVVGLPRGRPSCAFYNRGLLLFESREALPRLGGISFKVMDGGLEHTLSRDDVRRDAHFAEVLERIERAVHGPLTALVHQRSRGLRGPAFAALLEAACAAELRLDPRALEVPLAHPIGGRSSLPLAALPALRCGPCAPALGEALAARGLPVLAFDAGAHRASLVLLGRLSGREATAADALDTLVVPADDPLEALVPLLTAFAAASLRKPSSIAFARVLGQGARRLGLGARLEGPSLLAASELAADPFRLALRPPLVLNTAHPVAEAARRALGRGAAAPVVAAALVRALLAERDALATGADLLTEAALRVVTEGS